MKKCYQCGEETSWLATDSRCTNCTRVTPEEARGESQPAEEPDES